MKLKRFEALTLQEAFFAVKAELGSDAVIVSTRRINKGGGFLGLLSQPMIEVTAAIDRGLAAKEPVKASAKESAREPNPWPRQLQESVIPTV